MTVILKQKNVFGNVLIYPVCETAKLLTRLTGHITLSTTDIQIIEQLGYSITIQKLP